MKCFVRPNIILTVILLAAARAPGQQTFTPHIGYIYPAGGREGATLQVKVGGQYLNNVTNISVTGDGIRAEITGFSRPLTPQQANDLRKELKDLQDKRSASRENSTNRTAWTMADTQRVREIRSKLIQFQKRSIPPAIAETVTVKITIATNATPGPRELRLGTPLALSEPLLFCVGELPEFYKPVESAEDDFPGALRRRKNENAQRAVASVESRITLPAVVNGQVMQGGVDRYRFQARAGQKLVIAVSARALMPYLADAVPGWFQAALSLYDARGNEVAYADHFRFNPDPVLYYEAPKNGEYIIQIRDSIYRGREDFVYRITAGELPYITDIFPLGGPKGERTTVHLTGWNLPVDEVTEDDGDAAPGIHPISVQTGRTVSNPRPFAVDTLPEGLARRDNHAQATAQRIELPVIINGRIEKPGQWSVFRFHGEAGGEIVAEVMARRLESPLDSVLKLTDEAGTQLAFNDDYQEQGSGLQTQYADSYLRVKLPATGDYFLHLGDAQQQGGPAYAYRLRVSAPRPDFELRVVPSSLTVRGGMSVPLKVVARRRDGFTNAIALRLRNAPEGFILSGGEMPAGQNQVRLTLTARAGADPEIIKIGLQGRAEIEGREIEHPAIPSEDMMQAFLYRHLVPSQDLEVSVLDRPLLRQTLAILDTVPVKIPAGGTATVRVRTPGRPGNTNLDLELNEPPDGITLAGFQRGDGQGKIVLRCDGAKIKPGASGNLIINIVTNRRRGAGGGKARNQPPAPIGSLPAIPFQIVGPAFVAE